MKQTILLLFCCSFLQMKAQSYPQYEFYGDYDLSFLNQNAKNDADESERTELVLLLAKYFELSDKHLVDLYYRMYQIEHTSVIKYNTIDDSPLDFLCEDSVGASIPVDFGTPLISNNKKESEYYNLKFASRVTKIASELFSPNVVTIKLPSSDSLLYSSSSDICVSNLTKIEGYDVYDYSALINKEDVLIVAATKGKNTYMLPECVKGLGAGSLRGSTLSNIIIPSNVTSIGKNAFDQTSITSFFFMSTEVPQMDDSSFGNLVDSNVTIYVPKKSQKDYKKKLPSLKKQIKPIPTAINDTISLLTAFNPNNKYCIKNGLMLTNDNYVVNKGNRFYHNTSLIFLNESAVYLWKEIGKRTFDIHDMQSCLLKEYDVDAKTAKEDCVKILEKWYEAGLVCKMNR